MFYREAKTSNDNPPLVGKDLERFCYEFANLSKYAVAVQNGNVVEEEETTAETYCARNYFMGWRWTNWLLMDVIKREQWPETDFVEFVHDMVIRLGIVSFDPESPQTKKEFEDACAGVFGYKVPETVNSQHESQSLAAYNGWCLALNRGKINVGK